MPTRRKHHTVVGVFETRDRAERAIAELKKAGFEDSEIGMVARDEKGNTVHKDGSGKAHSEGHAGEGALIGAAAGAAGGALIGAGIMAGVIPVIGPVLALGTLGTILVDAAGGAALVGLAGALVGWGIPEEDAKYYEGEVQNGRFLVTVEAKGREEEARAILRRCGGFDRTGWEAVRADRACVLEEGVLRTEDGRTIQLHEEQLRAHKEAVQAGEVNVRKDVVTEQRQITVPVEREEVVVERRAVGRKAGSADIKSEQIRIPVKEEKVKVTKEPVVKEEVTVGKRKVRDSKTVGGTVRREELVVDNKGGARVRQRTKATKS